MESQYTIYEVLSVAKRQRNLLIIFSIYLLSVFAYVGLESSEFAPIVQLAILPLTIGVVVLYSILAFSIFGKAAAIILTILCVVPLANLIAFLVVNSRANKIIKSHGFRVGLAGADVKEIANSI